MLRELFLTTRQTKTQISKIIQSGGSFGSWFGNLGKKALTNIASYLAREDLPGLVSNLTSNAMNKTERKTSGKGAVGAGKGSILFISNGDIIKIMKLLEDSYALIGGVTETVKYEIRKLKGVFLRALLTPLVGSIVEPIISSVVKGISGRGARRAERGYMNKTFSSAPFFKQCRDH